MDKKLMSFTFEKDTEELSVSDSETEENSEKELAKLELHKFIIIMLLLILGKMLTLFIQNRFYCKLRILILEKLQYV